MAKYLFVANYSPDGIQGVLGEGGTGRRDAVQKLADSVGGTVESFYFAFGADDVFVVCDLPDDEAAAALAMTVERVGQGRRPDDDAAHPRAGRRGDQAVARLPPTRRLKRHRPTSLGRFGSPGVRRTLRRLDEGGG